MMNTDTDAKIVDAEPLFMSCSEVDHTFDQRSRRRALDILRAEKKTWHLQLFSGVEHGFALRGDPKDPFQRKSMQVNSPVPQDADRRY